MVTAIFLCKLLTLNVCILHNKHDGGLHYSSVLEIFEIVFSIDGICFAFCCISPPPHTHTLALMAGCEALKIRGTVIPEKSQNSGGNAITKPFLISKATILMKNKQAALEGGVLCACPAGEKPQVTCILLMQMCSACF